MVKITYECTVKAPTKIATSIYLNPESMLFSKRNNRYTQGRAALDNFGIVVGRTNLPPDQWKHGEH
jgi:hypothetical protein